MPAFLPTPRISLGLEEGQRKTNAIVNSALVECKNAIEFANSKKSTLLATFVSDLNIYLKERCIKDSDFKEIKRRANFIKSIAKAVCKEEDIFPLITEEKISSFKLFLSVFRSNKLYTLCTDYRNKISTVLEFVPEKKSTKSATT